MTIHIKMPKLLPNMEMGKLVAWVVDEGEVFEAGDPLYEVETDKVVNIIEAEMDGLMMKHRYEEGDDVPVGAIVAEVGPRSSKPDWLRVSYNGSAIKNVSNILEENRLTTVCEEANCPNIGECFGNNTATFMIMGEKCTRGCKFCNIERTARPGQLDPLEPIRVADAVRKMKLEHAVVTQVARDDLKDGGAAHMAETVRQIREINPETTIEVLISDLRGSYEALEDVLAADPDVLNHNMEMPKEWYRKVQPQCNYEQSLNVLHNSKKISPNTLTKTGFMVGLGESDEEISNLMDDILATGCDILTINQYLQPSSEHHKLARYVTPEKFNEYEEMAREKGFKYVVAAPLVRSSYKAAEAFEHAKAKQA